MMKRNVIGERGRSRKTEDGRRRLNLAFGAVSPFRAPVLRWFAIFWVGAIFVLSAPAGEPHASATLRPTEISPGESAQLNVMIEGTASAGAPALPAVDGLEFNHVGQSTQVQFINGEMSGGITHMYQVTPTRTGSFTIPAIKVKIGGKVLETNPVLLRVGKSAPSYSVPTSPSAQGGPPPIDSSPSSSASDAERVAMIRLQYPKRDFYVGELVPVDLKVYLMRGLQISQITLPALSGNAFTVGKISNKPDQVLETFHGNPYNVLTWHTTFAAVKAGEHPLGAQVQCTLAVRSQPRRLPNVFDDDFFNSDPFQMFRGLVQEKQVALQSPEETVRVLPLPTEGRPADFSGAVGQFQISASASPTQIAAGDPVTLKMTVSGTGNFDRLSNPTLESAEGWKTYPSSAKFEPTDEAGYAGQKTFEQAIIPQKTDIKSVPPLKLSYFDPEARKYVTLSSSAIPLQVSNAQISGAGTGPTPMIPRMPLKNPQPSSSVFRPPAAEELVPNKVNLGRLVPSLRPVILNPWFLAPNAFGVFALALTWMAVRRREGLTQDPDRMRSLVASRAVRVQLAALDAALRDGNTPAFFAAARCVLQERLGEQWNSKPETIALSDIESRLPADLPLTQDVKKVFERADAVAYSGQNYSSEALSEWRKAVLQTLKSLEGPR